MIYRHGQEVGPRAPLEPQEVGSGPSRQPRGTCKLWEFREQHIPKTSCSFSFLIEKSGFVFCFFSQKVYYFGYHQSLFVHAAGKPKLSYLKH